MFSASVSSLPSLRAVKMLVWSGAVLPVPLLCRVVFGAPLVLQAGEERKVFLDRAREALLALAPRKDGTR